MYCNNCLHRAHEGPCSWGPTDMHGKTWSCACQGTTQPAQTLAEKLVEMHNEGADAIRGIKTCGQPYCTGYPDDEQKHRDAERAEIVAWLRRRDELSLSNVFGWIADEIEEKEHLK